MGLSGLDANNGGNNLLVRLDEAADAAESRQVGRLHLCVTRPHKCNMIMVLHGFVAVTV